MAGRMTLLLVVAALVALLTPSAHAGGEETTCEPWQRKIDGECTTATRVAITGDDDVSQAFTDPGITGYPTGAVFIGMDWDNIPEFQAQPLTAYTKTFTGIRANVFSGYMTGYTDTQGSENFEVQVWEDDNIFHAKWAANGNEEPKSATAKGTGKWTIMQVNWNTEVTGTATAFVWSEYLLCGSEDINSGLIAAPEGQNEQGELGLNPIAFDTVNYAYLTTDKVCPFVCLADKRLGLGNGGEIGCVGPNSEQVRAVFSATVAPDDASARLQTTDNQSYDLLNNDGARKNGEAFEFQVSEYARGLHKVVVSASGPVQAIGRKGATAAYAETRPGPMALQVYEDGKFVEEHEFASLADTKVTIFSKGNGAFTFKYVNWEVNTNIMVLPGNFVFDVYCLVGTLVQDGTTSRKVCQVPSLGETCLYQNEIKFNPWERWNVFGSQVVMSVKPSDALSTYIASAGRIAGGAVQITKGTIHSAAPTAEPYIGKTVPRFSISSPGEVVIAAGTIVSGSIETKGRLTFAPLADVLVTGDVYASGHIFANQGKINGKAYTSEGYDADVTPVGGLEQGLPKDFFPLSADFEVVERYFIQRSAVFGELPESNVGYNVSNGVLRVRVHGKLNVVSLPDLNDVTVAGMFKQIREVVLVGHPHGALVINVKDATPTLNVYGLSVVYEDASGNKAPTGFGRVLLNFLQAETVILRDIDNPESVPSMPYLSRQAKVLSAKQQPARAHGKRARRVLQLDTSTHALHMPATKSRLGEVSQNNLPPPVPTFTHVSILAPKAIIVNSQSGIRGNVFGRGVQSFDADYAVHPFGTYARKLIPFTPKPAKDPKTWNVEGARKVACLFHTL